MFSDVARSLLIVRPEGVETFALPEVGAIRIGRAEGNEIRVDDPSLSRKHAVLHVAEDLRLEDLGGINPTRVRRHGSSDPTDTEKLYELARETLAVVPGDRILLGAVLLVVRQAEPETGGGNAPIVMDPRMVELFAEAERVAAAPINVLLLGETGVGKEVLAEFIHARSARAAAPLVAINCAALSESLLEAELFGSERGAFTGASQARPGLFETADRGTLFLDEVGELSSSAQAKILRVLEDQKVLRVGGRTTRQVDVRFIAATNRNLGSGGPAVGFRSDLYFRLAGATLCIPPLRERRRDVLPLALSFLAGASQALNAAPPQLGVAASRALEAYDWPGNARELRNVIQRASALCNGAVIELEHLPRHVIERAARAPVETPHEPAEEAVVGDAKPDSVARLKDELHDAERRRILDALQRCAGNQTRAAALLRISRRTLLNRLGDYDLPRPRKS
jgi:transcriptional regulator with PAS, ATPase and Fis domain